MKEQIIELRLRIDGISQLVKKLTPISLFDHKIENDEINSFKILKSYDSLILAKCWLGKVLGELNQDSNKTVDYYTYGLILHNDLAENSDKGYYVWSDGIKKEVLHLKVEFASKIKLTYNEVQEKFRNTKGIKDFFGEFKSPYVNDGIRKNIEDIEPTADVLDGHIISDIEWNDFNHIERVDWLRQEIQKIISLDILNSKPVFNATLYQNYTSKHLSEARFWLGFELGRVRELK